ncbi:glycoside hydrolase domain-containing protein [Pedobacter riviphilus]|uniref:glycoside hydrolase domain-containing protein n=1 Tax=Pedobacter riviphilus TaxID=2766984 RepID=UPI001CC26167|nr:glycoside hydrolase domain-containing protein [Pedobacter riviphilus]
MIKLLIWGMKYLFLLCFLGFYLTTGAQNKPNANIDWSKINPGLQVSFASSNIRYAKEAPPEITVQKAWTTKAWKGEKINTQVLLWSAEASKSIKIQVSDLKDTQGNVLKKENISSGFLKYVITDEFKDGCGYRKAKDFDSSYVADIIDTKTAAIGLLKNNTQPLWLSIKVPANAKAGSYSGQIKVIGNKEQELQITIQVLDRTLPLPANGSTI